MCPGQRNPASHPDPSKVFRHGRYIREEILGKPTPEKYEDYESYLEALVVWKLDQLSPQQTPEAKPSLDDYETYEAFLEDLVGWLISQPRNLTRRTDHAFNKALNPQEKRRRIDNANIQIVKLARQAIKTFRRAS